MDKIDAALDYYDFAYGRKTAIEDGLEFRNVSFSYGKEKVLDNVSFKVNKGETVALVGASGGGKTTVARLAARFYDADEGEILVGSHSPLGWGPRNEGGLRRTWRRWDSYDACQPQAGGLAALSRHPSGHASGISIK